MKNYVLPELGMVTARHGVQFIGGLPVKRQRDSYPTFQDRIFDELAEKEALLQQSETGKALKALVERFWIPAYKAGVPIGELIRKGMSPEEAFELAASKLTR